MQNLSWENEFYLPENKKSFSYQWFHNLPRFETKAWATRKWPINLHNKRTEEILVDVHKQSSSAK